MKITQKQLNGYYQAHREWISQNDNYNIERFGITKDIYNKIHHAIIDCVGISGCKASLNAINKALINL